MTCTINPYAVAVSCCNRCKQGMKTQVCVGNNAGGSVGKAFGACCAKGKLLRMIIKLFEMKWLYNLAIFWGPYTCSKNNVNFNESKNIYM